MSDRSFSWLSEQIVTECAEAIMFSDQEGIIRLWNKSAEVMFGYSSVEAVGISLDLIIPENLRGRHWEGYHRVMQSGESRYRTELLSAPGIRKDGSRISLEFSMVIVRDENSTVIGTAAIIRDVSARWQKEKTLREQIKALEAGNSK